MTGSGWGAAGRPRGHPVGAGAVQGEARMNEATAGRRGLAGRIAVVTGGAGRIGRAVVEPLHRHGATLPHQLRAWGALADASPSGDSAPAPQTHPPPLASPPRPTLLTPAFLLPVRPRAGPPAGFLSASVLSQPTLFANATCSKSVTR